MLHNKNALIYYTPDRFHNDVYVSISFIFPSSCFTSFCFLTRMKWISKRTNLSIKCERKEEEEEERFIVCKTVNEHTVHLLCFDFFFRCLLFRLYPYQTATFDTENRRGKQDEIDRHFQMVTWLTKMKRTPRHQKV